MHYLAKRFSRWKSCSALLLALSFLPAMVVAILLTVGAVALDAADE